MVNLDPGNDTTDFAKINNKGCMENVTPHKIAVVAFIREFGLLKLEAKSIVECIMAPKYRKDFCMLALKLIQCPDMEFKELENLLTSGKYNLLSVHLQNFCVCLQNIYTNGVSALTDCVTSTIDKLMMQQSETSPCLITRSSVLGFYLRRIMLNLDKLTFVQLVALYKSFCLYYQKGRPGLMIRSLSKEKLNNMDLSSTTGKDESKQNELSLKIAILDKDHAFEEAQWSRKQAELFTAQQANLLQIDEKKALPPKQLQKTIIEIHNDIPEFSDVHFLSFLNCIRMKEFCGAQDSLYNCFDRSTFNAPGANASSTDRNKHFRYAALNRAAMHTQFGHNSVALEGVREAMVMAQEAGDGACLAHVAAWAARAGGRRLLPRPPPAPRAAAAVAAAAHLRAQNAAVNGLRPAKVFALVTKGDSINYLHSMADMTMASLSNAAALWSLYGKTEMASIYSQLLLNLNPAGADGASGMAAVRGLVLSRGGPAAFPGAVGNAHRVDAHLALLAGKWEEAAQCIDRLASSDRWESQLLKAEMYFLRGDPTESLECIRDILDYCKTEDDSLHFVSLRLRGMLLKSQVQQLFGGVHSMNNSNIILLNEVLSLALQYHLHYIAATAEMHIANLQLQMGCARSGLALARRALPHLMAHAGAYDRGRALLLYCKARAAGGGGRLQLLQSCCDMLDSAARLFQRVGATARLLETCYFQAQLYNEIGNISARNQCAWMYRQLETQNSLEHSNAMLMLY